MTPRFTVVTATYNCRQTIEHCATSILEQSLDDLEWIVQDGQSSDGTLQLLEAWAVNEPRIRVVSQPDQGIYDAFNKALSRVRGQYVIFLGGDDSLANRTVLEEISALLTGSDDPDLFLGAVIWGDPPRLFRSKLGWRTRIVNTIHHQGACYRSDWLLNFEFDTQSTVAGDYELSLRALKAGPALSSLSASTVVSVCGAAGLSQVTQELEVYREMHDIRSRYSGRLLSTGYLIAGIINLVRRKVRA